MNDPPNNGTQSAPAETLAELEARLLRTYARNYARDLSQAEYARQVALMTAPARRPLPQFEKNARDMTTIEYRAALRQVGVHRR